VIEAVGTVRAVEGDQVLVEVERRGGCGTCASGGGCGTSALARWFSRRSAQVRLHATLPLRPGDAVVVGLDEGALLRASLLLYLVPILGLVMGTAAGDALAGPGGGDWPAVLGGLAGLAVGLGLTRSRAAGLPRPRDGGMVLLRRHVGGVDVPLDPGTVGTTTTRST
jgi:sigma-E factor negative regulatory protein RseC